MVENSNLCTKCGKRFGWFTRKKLCASCGEIVCSSCSSDDWFDEDIKNYVTLCHQCHRDVLYSQAIPDQTYDNVQYKTRSLCPTCTLIDKKGFTFKDAMVVQANHSLEMNIQCDVHSESRITLSSDYHFTKRLQDLNFDGDEKGSTLVDVEDLDDLHAIPDAFTSPLVVEIDASRNGKLLPRTQILDQVNRSIPKEDDTVIKINGGSLSNRREVIEFNEMCLFILNSVHSCPFVIEFPFDRMMDLVSLDDSIFLKSNVYPSVLYFLKPEEESTCKIEISRLVRSLSIFPEIQFLLNLKITPPFPDLVLVYELLAQHIGLLRSIVISVQRPISSVLNSNMDDTVLNVDIFKFYQKLEIDSHNIIKKNHFFPFSAAKNIECLIDALGYGRFHIESNPLCLQISPIVNTSEFPSTPLASILDIEVLLQNLKPLSKKLTTFKRKDPGFFNDIQLSRSLQKVLNRSARVKGVIEAPNIWAYLTQSSLKSSLDAFTRNLQFIVVHNMMDLGCIDLERRRKCCVATPSLINKDQLSCSCSGGCI